MYARNSLIFCSAWLCCALALVFGGHQSALGYCVTTSTAGTGTPQYIMIFNGYNVPGSNIIFAILVGGAQKAQITVPALCEGLVTFNGNELNSGTVRVLAVSPGWNSSNQYASPTNGIAGRPGSWYDYFTFYPASCEATQTLRAVNTTLRYREVVFGVAGRQSEWKYVWVRPGGTATNDVAYDWCNHETPEVFWVDTVYNWEVSDNRLSANPETVKGGSANPIGGDTNGPIYGITPTNSASGSTPSSTIYTNNIIWQNNDTTAARDATLKTGFGMMKEGIDDLIAAIDRNTLAALNGGGTNSGFGTNDALTKEELDTYLERATNSLGELVSGTNAGNTIAAAWGDLQPGNFGATVATPADDFDVTVVGSLADGLPEWRIKSADIPGRSYITLAKALAKWAIILLTLWRMFDWAEKAIDKLYSQRQMRGVQQEFAGFNASLPSALAYVGIVTTLIAGVPLILYGFMAGTGSDLATASGIVSTIGSTTGWVVGNMIIPVDLLILATINYLTYRFVFGIPLITLIRTVILWMVS